MIDRLRSGRPPAAPESSAPPGRDPEEGQALLFAVITLLFVFVMIFSVYRAGWVSHRKMSMQNSADLAAYAGATVEANNVSMMAFANRGMAMIYYNLMRYSVDCSVFALFKEFKDHDGFPGSFIWKILGTILSFGHGHRTAPDEYIATKGAVLVIPNKSIQQLYTDAKKRYDDEVPKGLEWIRDLYEINRAMAEATPMLVRREVYLVARANGATRVSLFPDTKRALVGGGQTRRMTRNWAPANDSGGGNQQDPYVLHETDLDRWAYKVAVDDYYPSTIPFTSTTLPTEPGVKDKKIPDWYDARQARPYSDEDYFQIRECWNTKDMDHADDKSHLGAAWFFQMKPAGHFHHLHAHFKQVGSVPVPWLGIPTMDGHQNDGHWHGPSGWTYYVPVLPTPIDLYTHHAVIYCPTCFRFDFWKWDPDFDLATEVMLELDDTDVGNYKSLPIQQHWPHRNPSRFAPPIVLGDAFFKYGVNVGVWRDKANDGNWLGDADWGYLCVASAKAGPIYGDRIVVFRQDTRQQGNEQRDLDTWLQSKNNLYHIPWGAKLIPVRDALYDNGKNTAFLMRGIVNGCWMGEPLGWRDPIGDPTLSVKLNLMRMPGKIVPWNWNANGPIEKTMKH